MLDKTQLMSHMVRTAYRDSNLTYGIYTILDEFRHFMMGIYQVRVCAT